MDFQWMVPKIRFEIFTDKVLLPSVFTGKLKFSKRSNFFSATSFLIAPFASESTRWDLQNIKISNFFLTITWFTKKFECKKTRLKKQNLRQYLSHTSEQLSPKKMKVTVRMILVWWTCGWIWFCFCFIWSGIDCESILFSMIRGLFLRHLNSSFVCFNCIYHRWFFCFVKFVVPVCCCCRL